MIRSLHAELLKYKRTPAVGLAVGVPVLVSLLVWAIVGAIQKDEAIPVDEQWELLAQGLLSTWLGLFLPLGVTILATLAVGLETGSGHLRHALAQPPGRLALFVAKLVATIVMLLIGTLVLTAGYVVVGQLHGFTGPAPWTDVLRELLFAAAAALPIVVLSVTLAFLGRWALSIGVGVAGSIVVLIEDRDWWRYAPWSYAERAVIADVELAWWLALWTGLAALLLGALTFVRRDVA